MEGCGSVVADGAMLVSKIFELHGWSRPQRRPTIRQHAFNTTKLPGGIA